MTVETMRVDYGYVEPVTVHFDDLDAMGVVHNARYALLIERAYVAFWARQGIGYAGPDTPPDAFAVVREFFITYHVPVRDVGQLAIHMWTEHLGTSSTTVGFRVLSEDGATVHADGHRVHIKLDPRTMRPEPWTDKVRELAAALARPGLDGTGLDGTGLDGTGLDGTGFARPGLDGTGLDDPVLTA